MAIDPAVPGIGLKASIREPIVRAVNEMKDKSAGNRHVLVVGGAGYVGSVLVRALLLENYQVRAIDRFLYRNSLSLEGLFDEPRFSFMYGDMAEEDALDRALEGITDVVLLASLVGDPISRKYPDLTHRVNLDASQRLFEMLQRRGIKRFIFTSTCSNYGLLPQGQTATEETELKPLSIYAETKVAMEEFILGHKEVDFSSTVLRIATAYGLSPRMRFDLTVNEFVYVLASGKELEVYDKGTWRPYCHVRDISSAIINVLRSDRNVVSNKVFNVGNDENNFTKKMLVDEILKHIDGKVSFVEDSTDPRNYRVSFEKIQNELGFEPSHSVRTYIPQLILAVQSGLFMRQPDIPDYYGNYEIIG